MSRLYSQFIPCILCHFLIFLEMSCPQHPTSYRHDCNFFFEQLFMMISNRYWNEVEQISHSCECWNWEKVDEKFNSVPLNWLRNRILWGSLKSLLWIGYNQNMKRSGWENSFSCETPLEHDASLIFRRKIRLPNQLYQPIPQHTHTHIGRYIMHCLPCVFGHFQFISSQRACLLN